MPERVSTFRRAAVLVAALGGSASAAAPITNGSPSSDTAVVAIAYGSTVVCTGTIIAPHAVLTAAHCLPDSTLPDVVEGSDPATGMHHRIVAAFPHPDFDSESLDHDIAVVIVGEPLHAVPLAFAATLPATAQVGATIRVVGYGWTIANDTTPPLRRSGTSQIDAIDALRVVSHAAPSQACEGDSGGPALLDDQVIGVASSGDTACTQYARHTRVDVHATFIAGVLEKTAEDAARPGDRCWYDANCATGACMPAVDEPRLSFCTPRCNAGACPAGLACTVDGGEARCRHPWPSPGADRHVCRANNDCAAGLCIAPAESSDTVCARRCFSDLPGFTCPVNTECREAADGTEACFAIDTDGGCAIAPGRDRGVLVLIGLVGVAVLLRRRPSWRRS